MIWFRAISVFMIMCILSAQAWAGIMPASYTCAKDADIANKISSCCHKETTQDHHAGALSCCVSKTGSALLNGSDPQSCRCKIQAGVEFPKALPATVNTGASERLENLTVPAQDTPVGVINGISAFISDYSAPHDPLIFIEQISLQI